MATRELDGRVVVVTGATRGIGRVAARELARKGATIAAISRDPQKLERLLPELHALAGHERSAVFAADLLRPAEARRVAGAVRDRYDAVHVLLNNAGAHHSERRLTEDGLEHTFALNHLAYFVMAQELLDRLKASAPSRIVNVSSDAHTGADLRWDDLQRLRSWPIGGWGQYSNSKLMNLWFTFELARRLAGTGVTVNAVHPGFVDSGFGRNSGILLKIGMAIATLVARTPEQGADTLIWACSAKELEGVSGRYYHDRHEGFLTDLARNETHWPRLWSETEAVLASLRPPS